MSDVEKKILVVEDSALMRRVLCDIINSDRRFQVVAKAVDGIEAFDLLSKESYDAVVLDLNMPRMNGLELLRELKKYKIRARVMISSTDSLKGASVTMDALELGALDFIQKPGTTFECRKPDFMNQFLDTLYAVSEASLPGGERQGKGPSMTGGQMSIRTTQELLPGMQGTDRPGREEKRSPVEMRIKSPEKKAVPDGKVGSINLNPSIGQGKISAIQGRGGMPIASTGGKKLVAIASSTGGPRALQSVIPRLPKDLNAPVLLVQHMPKGFTASLADRLNDMSQVTVREAKEGEILEKGTVYVAMGGMHLNIKLTASGEHVVRYSDEPTREGVKPCANYMYESLVDSKFTDILCVVMTGMGADGTEGIQNLKKEHSKNIAVISQNQETCVVYGMPKSVVLAGLSNQEVGLEELAGKISEWIGRR